MEHTSYIYIVAGWGFSGVYYSTVYRLNSSGGEFYAANLLTGPAAASVRSLSQELQVIRQIIQARLMYTLYITSGFCKRCK